MNCIYGSVGSYREPSLSRGRREVVVFRGESRKVEGFAQVILCFGGAEVRKRNGIAYFPFSCVFLRAHTHSLLANNKSYRIKVGRQTIFAAVFRQALKVVFGFYKKIHFEIKNRNSVWRPFAGKGNRFCGRANGVR